MVLVIGMYFPELQPAGRVGRSGGPEDASVAGGDNVEGRREVRPERRGREAAAQSKSKSIALAHNTKGCGEIWGGDGFRESKI